jgi:Ca2+-binding EF-hand superfamily protein
MLLMNSISKPPSKPERLKFAFNLLDPEENRMITFEDLLLIIQANHYAGSSQEMESKGRLLLKETAEAQT